MAFIGVEGADLTQQSLELGEQPLDGIEIGRIGRAASVVTWQPLSVAVGTTAASDRLNRRADSRPRAGPRDDQGVRPDGRPDGLPMGLGVGQQ